jgi:hypothetical protein
VTAGVIDDEGTTATGADSATVTFGNAEISGLASLDGLPPTGNGVQDAGEAPVRGAVLSGHNGGTVKTPQARCPDAEAQLTPPSEKARTT